MKHSIFICLFAISVSACTSTPKLSKEYFQGYWECYDYTMQDSEMTPEDIATIKATMRESSYQFDENILIIKNEFISFAFSCEFDVENKTITYSQLNNPYIEPSYFIIEDYTENTMVLYQSYEDSEARTFLQRVQ